jgi:hypothetical protein
MASNRRRCRPEPEPLGVRLVLSTASPLAPGTFVTATGVVPAPGSINLVTLPVGAVRFQARRTTVFGVTAAPTPPGTLNPAPVSASGASGVRLPFHPGAPYLPGRNPGARGYLQDGNPGPFAVGVTGRHGTTGPFLLGADLPGDVNGDGKVDMQDELALAAAYPSKVGDKNYNPNADFNHNGQVGQEDARLLLRNLAPLTPIHPLKIDLTLAPQDQARGHHPSVSGGATHLRQVTILGRTTPGAFVFADGGQGNYSFSGSAHVADAQGNFSVDVTLSNGITTFTFLAIDPYGQQTVRAFPIYWMDFNQYANAHPMKT